MIKILLKDNSARDSKLTKSIGYYNQTFLMYDNEKKQERFIIVTVDISGWKTTVMDGFNMQ